MIKALGIGLAALLLFLLEKRIYQRLWNRNLRVSVVFSKHHIFEGERSQLMETIENRKRLPLPMLKVKFQTSRHLLFADARGSRTTDRFYRNDVFRIGGGEKITRHLEFTGGRRGYYTIDNVDLVASDLFLTSQLVDHITVKDEIYVYPRPFDTKEFYLSLQQQSGEILMRRHLLMDPFEYRGIREYQPFDDMKSINWKATAKTGELKVNEKNYTSLRFVRVFYNIQDNNIMKKDQCVEAALQITAGICAFFLNQGMQVACYGNGPDVITKAPMIIHSCAGNRQMDVIYRALARVDAQAPALDFSGLFEEILLTRSQGAYTFFVSPNHYEDFLDLVEKYQDAGGDYLWFYPVLGESEPDLVQGHSQAVRQIEKIKRRIRFLHISD